MLARVSIALGIMLLVACAFQLTRMFVYPLPYWYLFPVLGLIAGYAMITSEIK